MSTTPSASYPPPGAFPAADGAAARSPLPDEVRVPGARHRRRAGRGPAGAAPVERTGSPIIPPGLQPAALTAGLAALIAVLAPFGQLALLPAVVLLQAVTAAGWFRLNGMWPARQGIALAFAAGLTADVVLLLASQERATSALVGTLGVWFVLIIVLQLRNRQSPDERLSALTATAAAATLAVLAGGLLAAAGVWRTAVVVAAVAVAVAALSRALLTVPYVSVAVALLAAAGAGTAAGQWAESPGAGALIGAAAGACALIGLRTASYDYPSRFVHFTAGVALPLTAAAPAAYVLARVLG